MNKNKDLHAFLRVPDNGTKGTKRNKVGEPLVPSPRVVLLLLHHLHRDSSAQKSPESIKTA